MKINALSHAPICIQYDNPMVVTCIFDTLCVHMKKKSLLFLCIVNRGESVIGSQKVNYFSKPLVNLLQKLHTTHKFKHNPQNSTTHSASLPTQQHYSYSNPMSAVMCIIY